MNRSLLFCGVLLSINTTMSLAQSHQPNIVVMFIDDFGYNDMGHRNQSFETPNLDQLAQSSLNFTNAYVASATSSPSRVALLTGRHPLKVGVIRHISNENGDPFGTGEWAYLKSDPGKRPNRLFMPLEEITIAEALKDLGYVTYHVGKWHLGSKEFYPQMQGFDFAYGESDLGQPYNYFPPYFSTGKKVDYDGQYLNDNLTDKAVEWIDSHDYNKAPLMMYFPHYAVHNPYIGQADKIKKYKERGLNNEYATYHAMVESMDESVGRVLKALKEKGVADNTIFILTSDQGGYFSNAPLRGGKMNGALYEGGCRVPFFVQYPKGCDTKVINERISTLDIFPTLVEMAGGKASSHKQLDGLSLRKTLTHGAAPKSKPIFFYRSYDDQPASVIADNFKLIHSRSGQHEMYDLVGDESETTNLFNDKEYTKKRKKLMRLMNHFLKTNEMPAISL